MLTAFAVDADSPEPLPELDNFLDSLRLSEADAATILGGGFVLLRHVRATAGHAVSPYSLEPCTRAAVGGGIALGDLGLYALGLGATRVPWLRRRYVGAKSAWARGQIERRLASAVLLARVIPGLRLATYTACGFVRVGVLPFTAWVLVAVALWTAGLYAVSAAVGEALAHWLGVPPAIAVTVPIALLAAAVPLLRQARRRLNPTRP